MRIEELLAIPLPLVAMHVTVYSPGESTITSSIFVLLVNTDAPVLFTTIQEKVSTSGAAEQLNLDTSPTSAATRVGDTITIGKGTANNYNNYVCKSSTYA